MVFNVTINQSYVTLVNPSKVSPLLGDLGLCAAKVPGGSLALFKGNGQLKLGTLYYDQIRKKYTSFEIK